MSSASPEYIQEVQKLQTLIQPDDGCHAPISSVRIIIQYILQLHDWLQALGEITCLSKIKTYL